MELTRERLCLVVTVLNEIDTIDELLESVCRQTRAADEVVIVDGGSTDGTLERLRGWSEWLPLTIVSEMANIARGRNLAIARATGELIAVTDAGVRLEPDWLEQLVNRLTPEVDVVAGFFRADPQSAFERALGATTLPEEKDVRPDKFLPSSRSVLFRRAAWQHVGGYPEWLDYCEDLVFDLALKQAGCRFAFAPGAIAWFRPRRSLGAFFRQYYLYARGDGKAGLWPKRHAIRYATYALATWLVVTRSPLRWLLLVGAFAYTRRPYQRLRLERLSARQRTVAVLTVLAVRLVGDVAKMLGYPIGVVWRMRTAWTSRSSS